MLDTPTIRQIPTDTPRVYAFRVCGDTRADDMAAMAALMNCAFDEGQEVDMLLVLEGFGTGDTVAGLTLETVTSQVRSLTHVGKYAVVGAPGPAAAMIRAFGRLIPVDARVFDPAEEAAAWDFVEARPA